MNTRHGLLDPPPERTAYLLDSVWPEYASLIAASRRDDDQLIAPGLWRDWPSRYAWPGAAARSARLATVQRHLAMRGVARSSGAVRQAAYLRADRAVARALGRAIDYRAGHLVVAQSWLPWLDEMGALGGRTFDVLMSRYPLAEVHRLLDGAAAELAGSATISDFRAPAELVERESALLARARRIVTPHHGIAELFGERAVRLAWHRPSAVVRESGNRVAFLGPTIARQRPDVARSVGEKLDHPLIVFGEMIEPSWWDGMPIERRSYDPRWLDGIGTILHPAAITNEPRRLLEALAAGVRVHATPACGLDPADYGPVEAFPA